MTPLARDIVIALVVKAIALALLWAAFFRTPPLDQAPVDAPRVEQRVFAPDSSRPPPRSRAPLLHGVGRPRSPGHAPYGPSLAPLVHLAPSYPNADR